MAVLPIRLHETITLYFADSSDIVDSKLKLILGLIWTLILHYSISMPMWEDEEGQPDTKADKTPKQRLLDWIQSKVPDRPITNFTSDWKDGKVVGALVDAIAPGRCHKKVELVLEHVFQSECETGSETSLGVQIHCSWLQVYNNK